MHFVNATYPLCSQIVRHLTKYEYSQCAENGTTYLLANKCHSRNPSTTMEYLTRPRLMTIHSEYLSICAAPMTKNNTIMKCKVRKRAKRRSRPHHFFVVVCPSAAIVRKRIHTQTDIASFIQRHDKWSHTYMHIRAQKYIESLITQ